MAELHYMEMGWSGSGWMDPLPMENTPSSAPAPAPSSSSTTMPSPATVPASAPRAGRRPPSQEGYQEVGQEIGQEDRQEDAPERRPRRPRRSPPKGREEERQEVRPTPGQEGRAGRPPGSRRRRRGQREPARQVRQEGRRPAALAAALSSWPSSRARAAAQLISAMWVKACGKLPEELPGGRVDLLGVEPDVVGVPEHPAEDPLGPLPVADHRQGLGQPEGADRERALLSLQPVGLPVAIHQLAVRAGELPRDRPARCCARGDGSRAGTGPSGWRGRPRRARRRHRTARTTGGRSLQPRSMISACSASRAVRQAAVFASRPSSSAIRTPRSSATQLITLLNT